MPSLLQVAILGCGSMGEMHARCLSQIDGVHLRALCDAHEARARALAEAFPPDYVTGDAGRIFADDAVDAVYICTYHDTHAPLALHAARAGKHIMMEKPLALTLDDCYAVGDAVEKYGITMMTAFKLRYYPSVARARQFIPSPLVTIAQMMDARWPDDFWANDPVRGGGNVLSQGCHTMDLVCHLNGSEPVRIHAEGGNYTHPSQAIVDNIVATIRFASGSIASVAQGDSGQTPLVSKFSFQLTDGVRTAHLHDRLKALTLFDGEQTTEHTDPEEYGFMEENRDFVHALRTGTQPPTTYRDGLRATLLLLRALESLRTGTPQTVAL